MGDSLSELTVDELLGQLAAPAPAPAGGSAAALVAAMAASLVEMIGRGSPSWPDGHAVAAQASELRARLIVLAAEDAQEVDRMLQQMRQSSTADQDEKRAGVFLDASKPPLAIAEAAAEIAELAAEATTNGKRVMRADAVVAAVLARAAAESALVVIQTNLHTIRGEAASAERSMLLQQARDSTARAAIASRAASVSTDATPRTT